MKHFVTYDGDGVLLVCGGAEDAIDVTIPVLLRRSILYYNYVSRSSYH